MILYYNKYHYCTSYEYNDFKSNIYLIFFMFDKKKNTGNMYRKVINLTLTFPEYDDYEYVIWFFFAYSIIFFFVCSHFLHDLPLCVCVLFVLVSLGYSSWLVVIVFWNEMVICSGWLVPHKWKKMWMFITLKVLM